MSSSTLAAPNLSSGVFTDTTSRNLAVSVRGLAKSYSIAHNSAKITTAGEALMHKLRNPLAKTERETFWALSDVNFDIQKGDVVGIIGRNGAGKSTLLKILSRITEPTKGQIDLYGRVGSLLEVGTGFHPELTGRENIFLNGAILGMKKSEISRQFDAIVDFSGTEKFLDTPVKRYSSGMYVRLAFAVAAHLNPEILIVDEVLAVGDSEFQKKCLGKMQDVAETGRTILFVSHNIGVLQQLCKSGVLLRNGQVVTSGPLSGVIAEYLETMNQSAAIDLMDRTDRRGKGEAQLYGVDVATAGEISSSVLVSGAPACFRFHVSNQIPALTCRFTIYDGHGQAVSTFNSAISSRNDVRDPSQGNVLECCLEELPLMPGRYRVNAALFTGSDLQDHIEAVAVFDVDPGQVRGRAVLANDNYGSVHLAHSWKVPA